MWVKETYYQRKKREAQIKNRESKNDSDREKIISALEGIRSEKNSHKQEDTDRAADKKWERKKFALEIAGLIGLFATVGVLIWQTYINQGQLTELQRQSALTISQLRPKLELSIKGPEEPATLTQDGIKQSGWLFTPVWENHGSTDAIAFRGWVLSKYFAGDAPGDYDFLNLPRPISGAVKVTVGPNQLQLQQSQFVTLADVQSVIQKKGRIVIWGFIEFRESLPGSTLHQKHFCYEIFPIDAGESYEFSFSTYRAQCNSEN